MSNELTTMEKQEISVSVSRDIVATAMGIDNLDRVSVEDMIQGYHKTEQFEEMAIANIKQRGDHDRGMYIEGIKAKEPDGWKLIVKDELGVAHKRANSLAKYFRDQHSFESLMASKTHFSTPKENFKLEDLSFPDTEYELRVAKGLTKKETVALKKRLALDKVAKERIDILVQQANLAKKASNYTDEKMNKLIDQLQDHDLEIDIDGTITSIEWNEASADFEVKRDTHQLKKLQDAFDSFSLSMKNRAEELLSNPSKKEKFKELGWTDEDEQAFNEYYALKNTVRDVPAIIRDYYPLWKKSYKEISKVLHPDTGGSDEAQALINAIGAEMNKAAIFFKYDKTMQKRERIEQEFSIWRESQSRDISIALEDIIEEILVDNKEE